MCDGGPPLKQSDVTSPRAGSAFSRIWLATPDWVFRVVGVAFVLIYAWTNMRDYLTDFPRVGPHWSEIVGTDRFGRPIYSTPEYHPIAKILTDLTLLLVGVSFCIRVPPRQRAARAGEIVIPLIAGVWPLMPFIVLGILEFGVPRWALALRSALGFGSIGHTKFLIGLAMLIIGNAIDVWGYATLCRSLSVVAEARILKRTGPYRFIRHPIYLGQFIAQAGLWLVLIHWQMKWAVFYAAFVAMQLYRSRVEDRVLERHFGEEYLAWKRRTFWFV